MAYTIDLSELDPARGFSIGGATSDDLLSIAVANAGDVNGDGIDDMIVGAPYSNSTDGAAFVIFGRDVEGGASAFEDLDVNALDPADGFTILGTDTGQAGMSVSTTFSSPRLMASGPAKPM